MSRKSKGLQNFLAAKKWDSPDVEKVIQSAEVPSWKQFVRGSRFDLLAGFLICLNAIVMAVELEYLGMEASSLLAVTSPESADWPSAEAFFKVTEHFFCIAFAVELGLRIAAWRCSYFLSVSNWLDVTIVCLSILETYAVRAFRMQLPNVTFLRLLRLALALAYCHCYCPLPLLFPIAIA